MIFEYSVILYSDFEFEVRMLITMFTYAHHFSVHSTIITSYFQVYSTSAPFWCVYIYIYLNKSPYTSSSNTQPDLYPHTSLSYLFFYLCWLIPFYRVFLNSFVFFCSCSFLLLFYSRLYTQKMRGTRGILPTGDKEEGKTWVFLLV